MSETQATNGNLNPHLACDIPDCKYQAKNPRDLHKHFCDKHLSGIVRPYSRIDHLRRIMKGTDATQE